MECIDKWATGCGPGLCIGKDCREEGLGLVETELEIKKMKEKGPSAGLMAPKGAGKRL